MTPSTYYRRHCTHDAMNRLVVRLLRDDSGVTPIEYVAAAVVLALAAVAASRSIVGVLTSFTYRVHIIASLLLG